MDNLNLEVILLDHPKDLFFGVFSHDSGFRRRGSPARMRIRLDISQRSLSSFNSKFTRMVKYRDKVIPFRLGIILRHNGTETKGTLKPIQVFFINGKIKRVEKEHYCPYYWNFHKNTTRGLTSRVLYKIHFTQFNSSRSAIVCFKIFGTLKYIFIPKQEKEFLMLTTVTTHMLRRVSIFDLSHCLRRDIWFTHNDINSIIFT